MDNPNGKLSNVELEMMVDELKRIAPYQMEFFKTNSGLLKARFDSLISEGFTESQALEIVKSRGIEL